MLENILEAILFVSGDAIDAKDIADKLNISVPEVLETALKLQKKYSKDCGIHLMIFNKKLQLSTNPDYVESVDNVLNPIKERELSRTMLEVCAIVAYKQPITRGEIDDIRGVASDYAVGVLHKHNIIDVVGRRNSPGKPVLFGTTDEFLKKFQLSSLKDLPDYDTLMERISVLQSEDSTDLFKKDTYQQSTFKDDDIPDFLKDEEVS